MRHFFFLHAVLTQAFLAIYSSAWAGEDEIAPRWSTDGNYIYFYSYRHPDADLVHKIPSVTMRMKPDGSEKVILSDGSSRNWWVVPDVCTPNQCADVPIFVISEREAKDAFGGSNLYLFNSTEDTYQSLTDAHPENGDWILVPSLSADGRYLSYIWRKSLRDYIDAKLFILDRATDKTTEVALPHTALHDAAITPDGRGIIYSPNEFEIYHLDLETKNQTLLYQFPQSEGQILDGLQASPDGKSILFGYGEGKITDAEIYLLNISEKALTRLTNNNVMDLRPSWHPDGSQIAFNRIPSLERDWNDIIIMNLENRRERNLTNN